MSFRNLGECRPEPMLSMIKCFANDRRNGKMDLGVGVYQDARGHTPVLDAVKCAEAQVLSTQSTKAYLGGDGNSEFVALLGAEAFGPAPGLAGLQTIGGTGALRLAADLLARAMPARRIWIGTPTWANHAPLLQAAGLRVSPVELDCSGASGRLRHQALLDALDEADAGDAFLVQACGHNPTGCDPEPEFWRALADVTIARGLVPLVDMAYQGLARGWSADAAPVAPLLERVPCLLIAYSCDKSFALYRERVGALYFRGANGAETARLRDHLISIARVSYSMPSDHGAATVRAVLENPRLRAAWGRELDAARERVADVRIRLARRGRIGALDLGSIADGRGLFARLDLGSEAIARLQVDHAIYLAPSGRINLAGLSDRNLDRFVAALGEIQRRSAA